VLTEATSNAVTDAPTRRALKPSASANPKDARANPIEAGTHVGHVIAVM
jgi:hypothetical protein